MDKSDWNNIIGA